MPSLHEWAKAYIEVGWNVFPLAPRTKVPNGDLLLRTGFESVTEKGRGSWKYFETLRVTTELVDEWWKQEPNGNIALVCGKMSDVTVIDIDRKEGEQYEEPAVILDALFDPVIVGNTGGDGRHVFCRYAPSVPNSTKKVHGQIDVKNDGGYIVLPPSIHDKTGNTYSFSEQFPFTLESLSTLPEIPHSIRTRVLELEGKKTTPDEWMNLLQGVSSGSRNTNGTRIIGKCLHAMYHEFDRNPDFLPCLWDIAVYWNRRNKPPLSEKELQTLFKSIVSRIPYEKLG